MESCTLVGQLQDWFWGEEEGGGYASSRWISRSLLRSMYFLIYRLSLTFCLRTKLGSKIPGWGQVGMSWRLLSIKHVA